MPASDGGTRGRGREVGEPTCYADGSVLRPLSIFRPIIVPLFRTERKRISARAYAESVSLTLVIDPAISNPDASWKVVTEVSHRCRAAIKPRTMLKNKRMYDGKRKVNE
ncbi:hypothetical protein WN48_09905 [Eufriesea mexicana]|nr:hypothetical protein WN48_09905 [Eufriesea mexicana]